LRIGVNSSISFAWIVLDNGNLGGSSHHGSLIMHAACEYEKGEENFYGGRECMILFELLVKKIGS
jgi:hypothetical protein